MRTRGEAVQLPTVAEEIEQRFEALDWHDTLLLSLSIDRRAPGERDEVVLLVRWLDDREQRIRFSDCYSLDAQMNFGVVAPELIRAAHCTSDSPQLAAVRQRWATVGVELGDLRCFEIFTSSTASAIRICARRFEVVDP